MTIDTTQRLGASRTVSSGTDAAGVGSVREKDAILIEWPESASGSISAWLRSSGRSEYASRWLAGPAEPAGGQETDPLEEELAELFDKSFREANADESSPAVSQGSGAPGRRARAKSRKADAGLTGGKRR